MILADDRQELWVWVLGVFWSPNVRDESGNSQRIGDALAKD